MSKIILDGIEVIYEIEYKKRKSIGFRVKDGLLTISCPSMINETTVKPYILKNKDWIVENVKNSEKLKEEKALVNGKKLYYLGEEYKLKILNEKEVKANLVTKINDEIILCFTGTEDEGKGLLKEWYAKNAAQILKDRTDHYSNIIGATN